jgi:hypothetical protein
LEVAVDFLLADGLVADSACLRFLPDARDVVSGAAPEAAVSAPIFAFFWYQVDSLDELR